jgi:DNA primase
VVEGYTDVLALHQAGIEEAVGVMGTAITEEQVISLSGMVDKVVLALDADAAGQEAMLRAQRVAADRKMILMVAPMPTGEDPAEMLTKGDGADRFRSLVEEAIELAAFRVGVVIGRTDVGSPVERDQALTEMAPFIAAMGNTTARDEQERRIAEALDLEPATVKGRIVAATPASGGPELVRGTGVVEKVIRPPRRADELTSRERRERSLLAMCIALPEDGKDYLSRLTEAHLSATGRLAADWLRKHPVDPASSLPRDDEELSRLIAELVMLSRDEPASPEAMELNYLLLEQRRIEAEIAKAGESGDREHRAALSRDRAALVERIARTERVGG